MKKKKLILASISAVFIIVFFSLPLNKKILLEKVLSAGPQFVVQKEYMSPEDRRIMRWGDSYRLSCRIRDEMIHMGVSQYLLLQPSAACMKRNGYDPLPEPAIFYYFTDIRSVTPRSSNVTDAKYVLLPRKNYIQIVPVLNQAMLYKYLQVIGH